MMYLYCQNPGCGVYLSASGADYCWSCGWQAEENSEEEENIYEDVYNSCCELIDPHIKEQSNGMYSIGKDSLIPSVVESLDYLINFWVQNRDKV